MIHVADGSNVDVRLLALELPPGGADSERAAPERRIPGGRRGKDGVAEDGEGMGEGGGEEGVRFEG